MNVGLEKGTRDGQLEGKRDGLSDGFDEGYCEGAIDGFVVGLNVGKRDGLVGRKVGFLTGAFVVEIIFVVSFFFLENFGNGDTLFLYITTLRFYYELQQEALVVVSDSLAAEQHQN